MKKAIILFFASILAIVIALGLVACASSTPPSNEENYDFVTTTKATMPADRGSNVYNGLKYTEYYDGWSVSVPDNFIGEEIVISFVYEGRKVLRIEDFPELKHIKLSGTETLHPS